MIKEEYNITSKTVKVGKNNGGKFVKGEPRPAKAGRKKGTPNKKTLIFLDDLGDFQPLPELIKLYENTYDDNIKFSILKELLKYMYPQRKAMETTFKDNNNSMAEFMQGLKEVMN